MTVDCLACGEPFERKRRGPVASFCTSCRQAMKRDADKMRMRRKREEVQDVARSVGAPLTVDQVGSLVKHLDEDGGGVLIEKPLEGARTPRGPEVGATSEFASLREELDEIAERAANHPWWNENPHWSYELDRPASSVPLLRRAFPDVA